jgi:hypothetical protein
MRRRYAKGGRVDKSKMACNKPQRAKGGSKKSVVKACKDGKEKIVRFGDPKLSIKKDQPKRKKSYCARSGGIKGKGDKFSANYWSRKAWNC